MQVGDGAVHERARLLDVALLVRIVGGQSRQFVELVADGVDPGLVGLEIIVFAGEQVPSSSAFDLVNAAEDLVDLAQHTVGVNHPSVVFQKHPGIVKRGSADQYDGQERDDERSDDFMFDSHGCGGRPVADQG